MNIDVEISRSSNFNPSVIIFAPKELILAACIGDGVLGSVISWTSMVSAKAKFQGPGD